MTETDTKINRANRIVKNYMLGALAVGIIPLPIVDLAALSAIQLKMLHSLARLYDIEFSEHMGKSLLSAVLGSSVPLSFSRNLGGLARCIPGYGQATAMLSVSLFGGASTYGIGKVFVQHFESGGTFLSFDPKKVKAYYAKQFEKGKEEVVGTFAGKKP
ncbi:MAG: YcjF family protein [Desulfobacterium sp.]|nr:YcjF family protein [Desulfobacterium sp.]